MATKAAIVAAALEEFAQLGLAGARMDEIARAARVNKALLYYYFESKEHLYQGVVEQMFVAMTDALRGALEHGRRAPGEAAGLPGRQFQGAGRRSPPMRGS